jgi:hypothetical protein
VHATPLFLLARPSIYCSDTAGLRHDPDTPGNHAPALFHPLLGGDHPRHYTTLCGEASVSSVALCRLLLYSYRVEPSKEEMTEPSNGGERFFYDYTGPHRDVRPVGTVFPVAVSLVRPSPPLQRRAGYCDDVPNDVEAHGDRTSPRPPLYLVRTPVDAALEPARGRRPGSQRPHHHPRRRSCMGTELATTPQQERDSPGRSSTPWHFSPCLAT